MNSTRPGQSFLFDVTGLHVKIATTFHLSLVRDKAEAGTRQTTAGDGIRRVVTAGRLRFRSLVLFLSLLHHSQVVRGISRLEKHPVAQLNLFIIYPVQRLLILFRW